MLRIGIIGSGFGSYGLMPAFRTVKGCTVTALCGSKREQMMRYFKTIGFTNLYADWKMMLEHEKLDAIAIAVTPDAQYEIAKAAIAKGIHVFAEKPLAATLSQAKELVSLAKKKKITHGIDFLFPEIAEWKTVKEMLQKRTLGKLLHLSVQWDFLSYDIKHKHSSWKTASKEGGGALAFYFSHGLHYLEHFAGSIKKIKCLFTHSKESPNGAEIGADLLLSFKNGITGTAHVCCNSPGLTRHQLIFYCENGVIVLENGEGIVDGFTVVVHTADGTQTIRVKKDKDRKNEGERVKIVRKLAERFVDACGTKKQMTPSFHEGLRVQELIEMCHRSPLPAE